MDKMIQELGYKGLTSEDANILLKQNGPNTLPKKNRNYLKKILMWIISPISLMLLFAAGLSMFNGSSVNFWIIIVLFVSNFIISFWHESKADSSIKKLQEKLTFKVKVFRDSAWAPVNSTDLVLGDIVELQIGSIVPADMILIYNTNLTINESILTGESLPKTKKKDDTVYSGSFVTTGRGVGRVTATGLHTSFGKAVISIDQTPKKSTLEKDIISISKFISIISLVVIVILTIVLLRYDSHLSNILTLDLSLLIAGIPVALPTVMSLIISLGVVELAKKHVVVRRIASLEDLANVDLLLSDKTGTLTENKIFVESIVPFGSYTKNDVLALSASTLSDVENSPFDRAVEDKAIEENVKAYGQIDEIPGDSDRKRNTATISLDGVKKVISLGAPQIIESLCKLDETQKQAFDKTVDDAAAQGYRAHVLSISTTEPEEKNMEIVGIIFLADKIRAESKETIEFMHDQGIDVKIVTGDNYEISKRVSDILGIKGEIYKRSILDKDKDWLSKNLNSVAGFAEVLPKDKQDLVLLAQKNHHIVAMTGDGINDLLAVKTADVGFAVSTAVDALKSTADIVLFSEGITVIKNAIIEARKIFVRLYNYSIYNISESFRLIITIAVIGLIYHTYPLTPVEIIILAFLNDIPIVSLAFDKVKVSAKPAHINAKKRFSISILFGMAGVANSLILLAIMLNFLHLPWDVIQTMFFLKLTVSGHMLVYVAHTEELWFKFLPSKQVIWATIITQVIATSLALIGLFTAKLSIGLVILVWIWSFLWMQISELMKYFHRWLFKKSTT